MKAAVILAVLAAVLCASTVNCDCICSRILDPVCDTAGNYYDNACLLNCVEGAVQAAEGAYTVSGNSCVAARK